MARNAAKQLNSTRIYPPCDIFGQSDSMGLIRVVSFSPDPKSAFPKRINLHIQDWRELTEESDPAFGS